MKTPIIPVTVLLLSASLAGGCDFLRSLAGRPTSAEIEVKREVIAREEAAYQARQDSLRKAAERHKADSLAALDSIAALREKIVPKSRFGGFASEAPAHRYHIIVGAFRDEANAARRVAKIRGEGYEALPIRFRNGYTAVGVCPSNSLAGAYRSLTAIRGQDFCPADVWILTNE